MPLDQPRWMVEIGATDKSQAGFDSFSRRMAAAEKNLQRFSQRAATQSQAAGFASLAAANPQGQAAGYAKLAAATARAESVSKVARLAETSGESLAAMYGTAAAGATKLNHAHDRLKGSNAEVGSGFAFMTRSLGPLIAAFSAAALAHKAFTVGQAAGNLKDEAQQLLLTTDQLQAYRSLASKSGI